MPVAVAATGLRAAALRRAHRVHHRAGLPVRRVHRHIDPRVLRLLGHRALRVHRATGLRPLPARQVIGRQRHLVRRRRLRVPHTQP